jgi:hypothetical protein
MPEVENECKFDCDSSKVILKTNFNGDLIQLKGIHLSPEQASSLSLIINEDKPLRIKIKQVE